MFSGLSPDAIHHILTACAFFLGCCIGSFMNVVVWRLPRGESLVYPPSHCPRCGHRIAPWENIPIISWLCLRARCSSCRQPISVKYPLGEGATGLLFALLWMRILQQGLPLTATPALFFLFASLLAAALIDIEHRIIPDEITVTGLFSALIFACALPSGRIALHEAPGFRTPIILTGALSLLSSHAPLLAESPTLHAVLDCILGALFGFMPSYAVGFAVSVLLPRGKGAAPVSSEAGIGFGDVKLLAMTGAFLGADAAVAVTLLSAVLALLGWGLVCIVRRRLVRRVALAPYVGAAALLLVCFCRIR